MTDKKPFDKEQSIKIPFSELVELINEKCDYKFAIIDNEVDEELMPGFSISKKKKSPRIGDFKMLSRGVSCQSQSLTS